MNWCIFLYHNLYTIQTSTIWALLTGSNDYFVLADRHLSKILLMLTSVSVADWHCACPFSFESEHNRRSIHGCRKGFFRVGDYKVTWLCFNACLKKHMHPEKLKGASRFRKLKHSSKFRPSKVVIFIPVPFGFQSLIY